MPQVINWMMTHANWCWAIWVNRLGTTLHQEILHDITSGKILLHPCHLRPKITELQFVELEFVPPFFPPKSQKSFLAWCLRGSRSFYLWITGVGAADMTFHSMALHRKRKDTGGLANGTAGRQQLALSVSCPFIISIIVNIVKPTWKRKEQKQLIIVCTSQKLPAKLCFRFVPVGL